MKKITSINISLILILSAQKVLSEPINNDISFYCDTIQNTLMFNSPWGQYKLINWVQTEPKNYFGLKWNPKSRCIHVAKKFQSFYENDLLNGFISGKYTSNSKQKESYEYPLICVGTEDCYLNKNNTETLLFTLQRGEEDFATCVSLLLSDIRFVGREISVISSKRTLPFPERCLK